MWCTREFISEVNAHKAADTWRVARVDSYCSSGIRTTNGSRTTTAEGGAIRLSRSTTAGIYVSNDLEVTAQL